MSKLTKSQKKRMVRDINSKVKKLFTHPIGGSAPLYGVISVADMAAVEKLTAKWLKRIG